MTATDPRSEAAESRFDLVVLGAGSGGYACALRAAQLGLSVALIEEDKLGGTCLHRGCIPTKALLHTAEVADTVRGASAYGVEASLDGLDLTAARSYRDAVVGRLFQGLSGLVAGRGIELIAGRGVLIGPHCVRVGAREVSGKALVLATGSAPRTLDTLPVDGHRIVNSDQALLLDRLPQRAVVVGGGVIGCEFASAWRSLGAEVTVVEALPNLLPSEEPASVTVLARAFRRRGIQTRTATTVTGVHLSNDEVTLTLSDGSALSADTVLVAAGRVPRSEGIGLTEHGVEIDRGFVVTDEWGRTGVPGVYAVGDLVAGPQLAHRGFAHGIVVAELIAGLAPPPVIDTQVPRVAYCVPEVASVGLTTAQAEERYGAPDVVTLTYDLSGNGKSQILRTQGQALLVRRKDGPVVGIHLVGERVGELIGEAQLIVGWEAHPEDVVPWVHAHPTQHEALGEAHLALAGKALHAHG